MFLPDSAKLYINTSTHSHICCTHILSPFLSPSHLVLMCPVDFHILFRIWLLSVLNTFRCHSWPNGYLWPLRSCASGRISMHLSCPISMRWYLQQGDLGRSVATSSILCLRQSEHAPFMPGIIEMAQATGWPRMLISYLWPLRSCALGRVSTHTSCLISKRWNMQQGDTWRSVATCGLFDLVP